MVRHGKPRVLRAGWKRHGSYMAWNWAWSLVLFAIAYVAFLQYHTVEAASDFWNGGGQLLLFVGVCLVTGLMGASVASAISGYTGWAGGVYGIVKLLLNTFAFACFGFFGLKRMLAGLGLFWAAIVYAIIKLALHGWSDSAGMHAGTRAGGRMGGAR